MKFKFIAPNIYVRIDHGSISIRRLSTGLEVSSDSKLAKEAFGHPRVVITNRDAVLKVAEQLRKELHRAENFFYFFKPKIIVQVTRDFDGGLTEFEKKSLREPFESFGREVIVLDHSRELTDRELKNYFERRGSHAG